MNKVKFLTAAALAVMAASISHAQTVLKVTGSTAYRKATYAAILRTLGNTAQGTYVNDNSVASLDGASQAVITGTIQATDGSLNLLSPGTSVVIQTAFAGSVGGVQVVTLGQTTIPGMTVSGTSTAIDSAHTWLSTSGNTLSPLTLTASNGISGTTGIDFASATFESTPAAAVVAMSDTLQGSTPTPTPALAELVKSLGVLEFSYVKGPNHPDIPAASYAAFTNITNLQAQALLAVGSLPLSAFTGVATDSVYDVLLVGRNNDSGTRLTAEAESGYGFNQTESLFAPVFTGSDITSVSAVGNVGYSSGSNVAKALNHAALTGVVDANNKPFILVGYLGKSDKNTATTATASITNPGTLLTWNGQSLSDTNIAEGKYSFWSYEHIFSKKTGLVVAQTNEIKNIGAEIIANTSIINGIPTNLMFVFRSVEGGPVQ